jgi:hypothetical protein
MLGFVDEFSQADITFRVYAATNALSAAPALVAIVLLLAPLLRSRAGRSTASEGEDGIIDVDSQAARDVEWPEWDTPSERRT